MNKKIQQNISDIIYNELNYMYCDNCRCDSEIEKDSEESGCEDCHRKYNGWGISKSESNRIAKMILKEVER